MSIATAIRQAAVTAYENSEETLAEVATRFGVSAASVRNWRRRKEKTGSVEPKKAVGRTGRPPILNEADRLILNGIVEEGPTIGRDELREKLKEKTGKSPSFGTIQRELKAMGIQRRRRPMLPAKAPNPDAPRYTDAHRAVPPDRPHRRAYPSDLTDEQWALLEPLLTLGMAPRPKDATSLRELVEAILYVLRAGCPWRYLPHDFPDYRLVHKYFRRWTADGTWKRINDALREQVRVQAGRKPTPTASIIDTQSVKTTEKGGLAVTTEARKSMEESDIS